MITSITITEIIGRSEQGATKPLICGAGILGTCYVKGDFAGKNTLCCEWVAHRLVQRILPNAPLGLPMFMMAEVSHALIQGSARKDARELGEGLVFASLGIESAQELHWSAAQGWPEETMCDPQFLGRCPRLVWLWAFGPQTRQARQATDLSLLSRQRRIFIPAWGNAPGSPPENRMRAEGPTDLTAPCLNRSPIS